MRTVRRDSLFNWVALFFAAAHELAEKAAGECSLLNEVSRGPQILDPVCSIVAYDEALAARVRDLMPKATEKRTFGGMGWMERGNLVVGVFGEELIVRLGPTEHDKALREDGVRAFTIAERPSKGWVLVAQEALAEDEDIEGWIKRARAFTKTLPAK